MWLSQYEISVHQDIDYPKFDTFFIKNGHFYNKIDVISRAERFAEVRFTFEKLIQNEE